MNLTEESLDNKITAKTYAHRRIQRTSHVEIADGRRPVYAVLTEPFAGDLVSEEKRVSSGSYVPKAHVQFLEQAGIRVVPLNYRDTEAIEEQLDMVNGVYCSGDSSKAIADS